MMTSSHDGEVLAAVARVNAILAASGETWEDLLSGASGPDLTQEQLQRVYDEGYKRGRAVGKQHAEHQQGWRGTYKDLLEIVEAAEMADLNPFERQFSNDMFYRVSCYGKKIFVTDKQWAVLFRLREKLADQGLIKGDWENA